MNIQKRIEPKPGQESVWDYPRPPRLEKTNAQIKIIFNKVLIADSTSTYRVLESSHPPVYYIPPDDIQMKYLLDDKGHTLCEWKGLAHYFSIDIKGKRIRKVAWYYPNPYPAFAEIKNYLAFYPEPMDACLVNGEKAKSQPGGFYGGWITNNIVGPFKGEAGTMFW